MTREIWNRMITFISGLIFSGFWFWYLERRRELQKRSSEITRRAVSSQEPASAAFEHTWKKLRSGLLGLRIHCGWNLEVRSTEISWGKIENLKTLLRELINLDIRNLEERLKRLGLDAEQLRNRLIELASQIH